MVTIKQLKIFCKEKNIKLLSNWNKDRIIFEIYSKIRVKFEKPEKEIKMDERKNKMYFIISFFNTLENITREEFIYMVLNMLNQLKKIW
jgi:hypothetical protein